MGKRAEIRILSDTDAEDYTDAKVVKQTQLRNMDRSSYVYNIVTQKESDGTDT
jgi:hypothetical protein